MFLYVHHMHTHAHTTKKREVLLKHNFSLTLFFCLRNFNICIPSSVHQMHTQTKRAKWNIFSIHHIMQKIPCYDLLCNLAQIMSRWKLLTNVGPKNFVMNKISGYNDKWCNLARIIFFHDQNFMLSCYHENILPQEIWVHRMHRPANTSEKRE